MTIQAQLMPTVAGKRPCKLEWADERRESIKITPDRTFACLQPEKALRMRKHWLLQ